LVGIEWERVGIQPSRVEVGREGRAEVGKLIKGWLRVKV
jgi:hypothetical protein